MGLVEEEWIATLATLDLDEVLYTDYVEVATELVSHFRKEVKALTTLSFQFTYVFPL